MKHKTLSHRHGVFLNVVKTFVDFVRFIYLTTIYYFQGESEHINLKVLGQDNAIVQFKIKKHTPLRKLMNAYCDRAVSIFLKLL